MATLRPPERPSPYGMATLRPPERPSPRPLRRAAAAAPPPLSLSSGLACAHACVWQERWPLPRVSTCFHTLHLANFARPEVLRAKLVAAMASKTFDEAA